MDATTKLYAFIGSPSHHSLSPIMHNTAFKELGINACYLAFDVPLKQVSNVITSFRTLKIAGANVSMPNKEAIIPYLDGLSKRSKLCNAVNTIKLVDNQYIGDITDGEGFILSIKEKNWDIENQKIVILGSGGASKAILVQLVLDGAKEIIVYNRSIKESYLQLVNNLKEEFSCRLKYKEFKYEELLKDLEDAYLLVNCTGVGMEPLENQSLIKNYYDLPSTLKVADIIYNPAETKLLKQAKQAKCDTMNGKSMLLYQGVASFKIWTGKKMPIEIVKKAMGIFDE